eukprot:2339779-Amphidinium_carterae.5
MAATPIPSGPHLHLQATQLRVVQLWSQRFMAPMRQPTQQACAGALSPACAGAPRGPRGGAPSADEMTGNVSFSADERNSAGDFRKESKTQLPKLDVSGAASAGPSAMSRGFEVWALRVGLTVASWTKSPEVARTYLVAGVLNLTQAKSRWQTWSVQTPTQRMHEQLTGDKTCYGYCPVPDNVVEAVLQTCPQEALPNPVVERCMVEQKVSSKDLLLETMKNVLPQYHTVRVALLDSIENQAVQKVSTIAVLHASLRDWLEVLKLAMRRCSLQLEPSKSWLAIWARVQPLYKLRRSGRHDTRHGLGSHIRCGFGSRIGWDSAGRGES